MPWCETGASRDNVLFFLGPLVVAATAAFGDWAAPSSTRTKKKTARTFRSPLGVKHSQCNTAKAIM
jgi:hypothetical protein